MEMWAQRLEEMRKFNEGEISAVELRLPFRTTFSSINLVHNETTCLSSLRFGDINLCTAL